jgi:hypothetical protein
MKRYMQIFDDEVIGADRLMTEAEADNINLKLACDGAPYRWVAFATRELDLAA